MWLRRQLKNRYHILFECWESSLHWAGIGITLEVCFLEWVGKDCERESCINTTAFRGICECNISIYVIYS